MGDTGDDYRAWKEAKRRYRKEHGVLCEDCIRLLPKAHPSILLPGQKCRMHPFKAPKKEVTK